MDISKLDEYQGLEAQMVREWMTRKGCYRQDEYWHWRHPHDKYRYTDGEYGGLLWEDTLFKLSVDFELASVQALLREINPRMHKGMPSEAARDAHGGPWVGHMGGEFPLVAIGCWNDDGSFNAGLMSWDEHKVEAAALLKHPCAFWPCDANGNKVLWPTDANGALL